MTLLFARNVSSCPETISSVSESWSSGAAWGRLRRCPDVSQYASEHVCSTSKWHFGHEAVLPEVKFQPLNTLEGMQISQSPTINLDEALHGKWITFAYHVIKLTAWLTMHKCIRFQSHPFASRWVCWWTGLIVQVCTWFFIEL